MNTPGNRTQVSRDAGEQHRDWLSYYLDNLTGASTIDEPGQSGRPRQGDSPHITGARRVGLVEEGLPLRSAEILRQRIHMTTAEFSRIGIPRSTLASKRQRRSKVLSTEQSDRVMRIAQVYAHAAETFGDPERGQQWMARTNPHMPNNRTPADLLGTETGAGYVEEVLTQLDYGIPA